MEKQIGWAKEVFFKNTEYTHNDVIKIKQIHKGYTNISFCFFTNDNNKFQVRIARTKTLVDRINEKNVLDAIQDSNYIYFDKHGNAIKKWIIGINPHLFFLSARKILSLLIDQIEILHSTNIDNKNIIIHDHLEYLDQAIIDEVHKDKYLELVKEFEKNNIPKVLSHNDINPKNIIFSNNALHLIDFEWARVNYYYWDIANCFKETNLKPKWINYICNHSLKYDKHMLLKFIYFTTNFSYQWTFSMEPTKKLLKYRKLMFKKMNYFFKLI